LCVNCKIVKLTSRNIPTKKNEFVSSSEGYHKILVWRGAIKYLTKPSTDGTSFPSELGLIQIPPNPGDISRYIANNKREILVFFIHQPIDGQMN
jgi:hypothetical protein